MNRLALGVLLFSGIFVSSVHAEECPTINGTFVALKDGHSNNSGNLGISSQNSNGVMTYTLRDQWARDTQIIVDGRQHLDRTLNAVYSAICTKNSFTVSTESPNANDFFTLSVLDSEGNLSLSAKGSPTANFYKASNQIDHSIIDSK